MLKKTLGHEISQDTLQRHYRDELDAGKAVQKEALLARAHDMALGRNLRTILVRQTRHCLEINSLFVGT